MNKIDKLTTDLYGITAEKFSLGRSNIEVVEEMIAAGVKIIQYREKEKKMLYKYEECQRLRELTKEAGVTFIINDDIHLALVIDADGVHIGQEDLPLEEVRKLLGEDKIIGLSTHSPQEAEYAVKRGADYIGVGPIFKTYTKEDGSAFLAGILLGLTLPPAVPWWIPILGGFLTVVVGKHLFGGLGSNIFNPALVARAILLLSYPALMIEWVSPVDGVSAATALQLGSDSFSYTELIIGNIPGSIGETSVIALLIGGAYLYLRDYIDLRIPLSFIAGAAGAAMFFGQDPIFAVFSGGLIFAAIYMATDMVTSPVAKWAKIVYGLTGGFLTIFIRRYTPYPEGITFAILIINGASYFLDNAFEEPHFGEVEYVKKRVAHFSAIIMAAVLILLVGMTLIDDDDPYPGSLTYNHLKEAVPAAESFEIIERDDNDILFAARAEEEIIKDLVYISRNGFEAPIELLLSLEPAGSIDKIQIINESESPTLGARIKDQEFLSQFREFTTAEADQVMAETDMISGATYSSQTVSRGVQAGLRLLIAEKEAGLQDGVYQGQAEGAQGDIVLEITVENGDIVDLEILKEQETEHLAEPAYEELEAQLLREQTADLDVISGATYTSEAYMEAVQKAIDQASPESSTDGDFEAGTYQGSAQGHSGQIELEVVVEAGEITEIEVLSQNETEGLGDDAIEEIAAQIISEQSLEVDSVSGATNSSEGTINAVRNALNSDSESAETDAGSEEDSETDTDSSATWEEEDSEGEEETAAEAESESGLIGLADLNLENGEYRGSAEGHRAPIEVSVLVEANEINEIRIVSQEESPGIGDEAMAELSQNLLAEQSLEVDLVSGATNSSEAFLKAINNALTGERYGSLEEAEDLQTAKEILAAEEDSDTDSSATWEEESTEETDEEAVEGGSNG
ncbi:MAG: thiamine-phosphate pyrophosphorylase [Halanaerobium sp.]|jgi:thiamine-phosphate diphosphorylase|nr:thiamine phosphate synthase [Halanaerobium sp.]PUU89127.1 MAG: thiamine-phosphate pyrophosphorylase [Halanaerobium sp.]